MERLKTLLQGSSLRWNFVGNVAGRLWLGFMSIGTVPVFVHLLGTEAFGIVALVGTLQSVLGLLDFGLAGTVNREVATLRGSENRAHIADVVRTFELIYWAVALAIGLGIAGLSGWIAHSWLSKQSLSPADLRLAIILGGIALAARWPVALYTGVLQGLERQVLQNGILIAAATMRVVMTLAALLLVSRTVYCFLATQALANVLEVLLSGYVARRLSKAGAKGRFNLAVLQRVWRFAVGFNLVGTFGSLVSGSAQLLISKLLPLVELTYYSVASTATGVLQVLSIAAQVSLFPRIAGAWQQRDLAQMRRIYLVGLRCTVYFCTAPAILLIFFPSEIVGLWTASPELTQNVPLVLPVLAIAILINTAVATPLNVQLASGHTRLPLLVNVLSLPFMVLGCYLAIRAFGIVGAAGVWLAWNCVSFALYGQYCFRKLLGSGTRPFLWGLPLGVLLTEGIAGYSSQVLMPRHLGPLLTLAWLLVTMLIAYGAGMATLKHEERSMLLTPIKPFACHLQGQLRNSRKGVAAIGL